MYDKIAYIHNNKLAKWNYEYIGKDGTIYVGQRDGRLKKKEVAVATTPTTGLDVSLSWGNITGDILNQIDLITYINSVVGAITLDGLADVTISAPAPGDVLTYDSINNIWVNAPGGVGVAVTTFSGGTTGLTPAAPTSGAVVLGGTLAVANGGTGLNALGAATNYLRVNAAGTALEYWPFPAIPVVTPSALTKSDDTNVTLTLGGTPATALLQSVSLTLGWTGTLAIGRGGTNLNTLGTALQYLRVKADASGLEYATFPTIPSGTVTSVSASVPSPTLPAYSVTVTNPTTTPAIAITALGAVSQYVRGDGSLATFPTIPPATTVTGRTGDINIVTSGSNYEVQNAVLPFLLMGC